MLILIRAVGRLRRLIGSPKRAGPGLATLEAKLCLSRKLAISSQLRQVWPSRFSRQSRSWRRNGVLVLDSEEFFREPHNTLRRVFDFVQVDTDFEVKDLVPERL